MVNCTYHYFKVIIQFVSALLMRIKKFNASNFNDVKYAINYSFTFSYGTYGFYSSFLAGGQVIMACGNVNVTTKFAKNVFEQKIPDYHCLNDPSFPPVKNPSSWI